MSSSPIESGRGKSGRAAGGDATDAQPAPSPADQPPPKGADQPPPPGADHRPGAYEVFESETDALSIEHLRDLWERFASHPAVAKALGASRELGLEQARSLTQRLLRVDVDRAIDPFGCDPEFVDQLFPIARWFHDKYFRCESRGVEHIPSDGRVLLVANHSGTLPYDGAMVVTAVKCRHASGRLVRPLVEDFVYHFPYLGMFMARVGAIRASQENAQRLLEADEPVLVFPEGVKGIGKLYRRRYRLQRFGRGGAIKLAMNTGAPIIPVSIVGAEESMPLISKMTWLARPLGLPYIPITPTLPLLGPLGLIPYPTKWYVDFGEPIDIAEYGPDAAQDRVLVNKLNERIRAVIQDMIDQRLRERHSVLFG